MLNYIRYRLGLDSRRLTTFPNYIIYTNTPTYGNTDNFINEYDETNPGINMSISPEDFHRISIAHEGLPIFKNKYMGEYPSVHKEPFDPNTYWLPVKHILHGMGHMLAESMASKPNGFYTLDDYFQDNPHAKSKVKSMFENSPIIPEHHAKTSRNAFLYSVLPTKWHNWYHDLIRKQDDGEIPHDVKLLDYIANDKQHNDEDELSGLLRHGVREFAHKSFKMALDPAYIQASFPGRVNYTPHENNHPFLHTDEKHLDPLNRLVHITEGVNRLYRNPARHFFVISKNKYISKNNNWIKPVEQPIAGLRQYTIHPDTIHVGFGHNLVKHINKFNNLSPIHDVLQDIYHGDKGLEQHLHEFLTKYKIPSVSNILINNTKPFMEAVYPYYHGELLNKMPVDLRKSVTSDDLQHYLTTPHPDHPEGFFEALLREAYNNA